MNALHGTAPAWSFGRKLWFRVTFVFFVLIIFPFPITAIPGGFALAGPYTSLWAILVKWVGQTVFDIQTNLEPVQTGSGDTLYNWLWYVVAFGLTVLIAGIWTAIDRKRTHYRRTKQALVLYVTPPVLHAHLWDHQAVLLAIPIPRP